MEKIDLPYMGFYLSWFFLDRANTGYKESIKQQNFSSEMRTDLLCILNVLEKYELLFVDSFRDEKGDVCAVTDKFDLIKSIETRIENGEMNFEIMNIDGNGMVYFPDNVKKLTRNLISIDFRLSEKNFSIDTSKSIWSPLSIDQTYEYSWQIELARLNNWRLENCLKEIHKITATTMEPAPDELDREEQLFLFNYKVYLPRTFLIEEWEKLEDKPDISDFLLDE
jgi:hypothetical protein